MEMFIRYLDFLSPRVTFYHKGFLSHNSIFSGILSIISIILILILAGYYFLEIIQRKDPNAFYFNTFVEDTGVFSINSSSLFHFLVNVKNVEGAFFFEDFDFTAFNVIGTNYHYENYLGIVNNIGIENLDHWLYGYCNKEKNTQGLDDLLTYDFFEKSACLKQFYDSKKGKYYEIGDENFVWPEIAHGTFNENSQLYNIIVQRCNNKVLEKILGKGYSCKNDSEMKSVFNFRGARILYLYVVNNFINVLNYETPNYKFFYRIENPLYIDQYSSNNLNFNPALIKTNDGLILDNIKEEISYILSRNDVYTGKKEDSNAFVVYGFFLKNIVEYYERTYKRLQDVISSIGGVNQAITIIAIYLNSLYNNFIVLSDTEMLLHSSITIEKNNNKEKANKIKNLKKIKDLEKPKKINSESKENLGYKRNIRKNIKETSIRKDNEHSLNDPSKSRNLCFNKESYIDKKNNLEETNINKIKENKEDKNSGSEKSFCAFLFYKMTCGRRKNSFGIYEKFRIKIISEEHLIRNHLAIYNLIKINERKKHYRRNSYQLSDLINLI